MNRPGLTKIVAAKTVLVSAFVLAACHTGPQRGRFVPVEGLSSSAGQKLVTREWCTETRKDDQAHFNTDHFTFRPDGQLFVTTMQLQNDGTAEAIAKSEGNWSIANDQLFMMDQARQTQPFTLTPKTRASDKVDCFSLEAASNTALLCPCVN